MSNRAEFLQFDLGLDFGNGDLNAYLTGVDNDEIKPCRVNIPNAYTVYQPKGKDSFGIRYTKQRFNPQGKELPTNPIFNSENMLYFGRDILGVTHAREIGKAKYTTPDYIEALTSALLARLIPNCNIDLTATDEKTLTIHVNIATSMPVENYYTTADRNLAERAYMAAYKSTRSNWFIMVNEELTLRVVPNYVGLYPETLVYYQSRTGVAAKTPYHLLVDVGYGTTDYLIMEKGVDVPRAKHSTKRGLLELFRNHNPAMLEAGASELSFLNDTGVKATADLFLNSMKNNVAQMFDVYTFLNPDNTTVWLLGGGTKLMTPVFKQGFSRQFKHNHYGDHFSNATALNAKVRASHE